MLTHLISSRLRPRAFGRTDREVGGKELALELEAKGYDWIEDRSHEQVAKQHFSGRLPRLEDAAVHEPCANGVDGMARRRTRDRAIRIDGDSWRNGLSLNARCEWCFVQKTVGRGHAPHPPLRGTFSGGREDSIRNSLSLRAEGGAQRRVSGQSRFRHCDSQRHAHKRRLARNEIPAGAIVNGFIHLLFIGKGDGIWSHPRNVIVAGATPGDGRRDLVGNRQLLHECRDGDRGGRRRGRRSLHVECESPRRITSATSTFSRSARSVISRNVAIGGELVPATT